MNAVTTIGEYVDRKRTLPKRVLNLALRLSSLTPGRYVFVIDVAPDKQLTYEEATLPCRQNSKLVLE